MFARPTGAFAYLLRCLVAVFVVGACVATASLGAQSAPTGESEVREPDAEERAQRRAADKEREQQRAEDDRKREARRERRKSPEETEARRRSRIAFKKLSAEEALATGRRFHGATLERPVEMGLRHRKGEKIKKLISDNAAVVDLGEGKPNVVVSSVLPLQIDGKRSSLKLRDSGEDLRPENSVSDVRIGKKTGRGVRLSSGVGFRPVGSQTVDADLVAGKAFFANVSDDTDYVVEPQPGGAQALFVLRSEDSASNPGLAFDLPAGAQIRLAQQGTKAPRGSAEVVRDDKVLTTIAPPLAWDADEEEVPVAYELDGDVLRVRVDHQDQDFNYPIVVDPNIIDSFFYWDNCYPYCLDGTGWDPVSSFGGFGFYRPTESAGWWKGRGLYVIGWPNQHYPGGAWADWRFYATRTAHIYRADFQSSHYSRRSRNLMGLWRRKSGGWEGEFHNLGHTFENHHFTLCAGGSGCPWESGESGNWAVYGINVDYGWQGEQATAVAQGAAIYQWEGDKPVISSVTDPPGGWLGNRSFRLSVNAHDAGLGVSMVRLTGPGVFLEHPDSCANPTTADGRPWIQPGTEGSVSARGWRHQRCPDSRVHDFDVATPQLGEGLRHLNVRVEDVVGNFVDKGYSVNVDLSDPSLTLSDDLSGRDNQMLSTSYRVRINASDAYSGVAKIKVLADGAPYQEWTNPDGGDGAPYIKDWDLDLAGDYFREGKHKLTFIAVDRVGRSSAARHLTFVKDRVGPTLTAIRHDPVPPTHWINDETLSVTMYAHDFGSGVKQLRLFTPTESGSERELVSSFTCSGIPTARCPHRRNLLEDANWSFELADATDGWREADAWSQIGAINFLPHNHGPQHLSARRRAGTDRMVFESRHVPVTAGKRYKGHHFARPEFNNAPASFHGEVVFWNSSGQEVTGRGTGAAKMEDPGAATMQWTRSSDVRVTAPVGAVTMTYRLVWVGSPVGEWHNADAVHVEEETDASRTIAYNARDLPQGRLSDRQPRAYLEDAFGRDSNPTRWTLKVDRSTQAPVASGALHDRRGRHVGQAMTLHLDAQDGSRVSPREERSGVAAVEMVVDGQSVDATMPGSQRFAAASCTHEQSSCPLSGDVSFNPASVGEGWRSIGAKVTDFAGNTDIYPLFNVFVDRTAPTVAVAHETNVAEWHSATAAGDRTRVTGRDGGVGVKALELTLPWQQGALGTASDTTRRHEFACELSVSRCLPESPHVFGYSAAAADSGQLPEGRNALHARAIDDAALPSASVRWDFRVDRSLPRTQLSGSLKSAGLTPLTKSAYDLNINATDGQRAANDSAAERAKERSGVRSIQVFTRFDDPAKPESGWGAFVRQDGIDKACPPESGSCPLPFAWTFRTREFRPGPHSIKVETRDAVGHLTTDTFKVIVGVRLGEPVDATGLEDWYQLDSTQTGGDTQAHVNLATGNLVWHATPIIHPGRGLSTVVNVTYNSQRRTEQAGLGLDDLAGIAPGGELSRPLAYDEVGTNVSLGISGVTRLNEPLDVSQALVGGPVELTDADGTHHVFEPAAGSVQGVAAESYIAPPGVDLHLRRFSANKPDSQTTPGQLGLLEEPKRTWAMTRPDGVTHFFDQFGFQTLIVDRDKQTIEFRYQDRGVTGAVCELTAPLATGSTPRLPTCVRKLVEVIDPAGATPPANAVRDQHTIMLAYEPRGSGDEARPTGRLSSITDHAKRKTTFSYDARGNLEQVKQHDKAGGLLRDWKLGYESPTDSDRSGATDPEPLYLQSVTDPRGAVTDIDYEPRSTIAGLGVDDLFSGRRVTSIRDRRDSKFKDERGEPADRGTQFLITDEEQQGKRFTRAQVADARSNCNLETQGEADRTPPCNVWRFRLDDRARMFEMADARKPTAARTELAWDADNRLKKLVRAAGTDQSSEQTMLYNQNGLLVSKTDPAGTTFLNYEDSPGPIALRSQRRTGAGATPNKFDDSGVFVSDLVKLTDRRGQATEFKLDPAHPYQGRVIERRLPGVDTPARTEYDPATGVVTAEVEEPEGGQTPRRTEFRQYDENGNPRQKVDSKGGVWISKYDAVGNLLQQTDPRAGVTAAPGPGAKFTRYFTYDGLDRRVSERAPKDTGSDTPTERKWIDRSWSYDANGNVKWFRDGEGAQTDIDYTAMDDPEFVQAPAAPHDGEGSVRQLTHLLYDEEENVRERDNRNGRPGDDGADDRKTEMRYDEVEQLTAEIRKSTRNDDAIKELATSYAYDLRGNRTKMVDPAANASGDAAENVKDPAKLRFLYEYDRADRRTAQVEDPAGLRLRREWAFDPEGNVRFEYTPRAFTSTGVRSEDFRTESVYNERGLLVDTLQKVKPALGEATVRKTHREYFNDGRLKAITSPRGTETADPDDFTTRFTYDPLGLLHTRSVPRAAGQYGPAEQKVTYGRDAVGHPKDITDARGKSFKNTFYDSGEIKTTGRPSFWKVEQGHGGDFEVGERSAQEVAALATGGGLPSGEGHGDFGKVDQEQMPDLLPKAGVPTLEYDNEMRPTAITEKGDSDGTGGTGPYESRTSIERDKLGRVVEIKRPHDTRDEDSIAGNAFLSERYGYDRNDNRVTRRAGTAAQIDAGGGALTRTTYDDFDREIVQALPSSSADGPANAFKQTYDRNGNLVSRTTPAHDATWRFAFDAVDRQIAQQSPVRRDLPGGQTSTETTCSGYDAAGNAVWERSPRGSVPGVPGGPPVSTDPKTLCAAALPSDTTTGCETADQPAAECFTTRRTFNGADELVQERDGLGHATTFGYDPNGNQVRVEAPGAQPGADSALQTSVTCREFDGRDLPWTQTTGVTGAKDCAAAGAGEHERTTVTEHDENGNLVRRVNPSGVDDNRRPEYALDAGEVAKNATVMRYSNDNVLEARLLPWDNDDQEAAGKTIRYRQNYSLDTRGRVRRVIGPYRIGDPQRAQQTEYTRYDTGWIQRSKEEVDYPRVEGEEGTEPARAGQRVRYEYDGRGNQTRWRSTNKDDVELREVTRSYFPGDQLAERKATALGETARTYGYAYDANGQIASMRDEAKNRPTHFTYDFADRERRVNECWDGGEDTFVGYDEDGNVTERKTDGRYTGGACDAPNDFQGGKTTSFKHDPIGREGQTQVHFEQGQGLRDRRYRYSYWPSGARRTRTKLAQQDETTAPQVTGTSTPGSGTAVQDDGSWKTTVVDSFYEAPDGRMLRKVRDPAGEEPKTQSYIYDANGNRLTDERGSHAYNARDQLIKWTRDDAKQATPTTPEKAATHVDYTLNASGAITFKKDSKDGSELKYNTTGDQIDELVVSQGGATATFRYEHNDLGSVKKIIDKDRPNDAASTLTYDYDSFNRLAGTKEPGATSTQRDYEYDALDRRDVERQGTKTFDLSYIGTSENLSQRAEQGVLSTGVAPSSGRFDYDSQMQRLGMASKTPTGGTTYKSYATDANGSVTGLENDNDGSVGSDSYKYDPYGQLESQSSTPDAGGGPASPDDTRAQLNALAGMGSTEGELSDNAQANPFRYTGFYADPGGTYDMQARAYRPSIGRFLSEDRFEAAQGDFNLQADPLTQNRYAFAGGNPVNNVEFNGHEPEGSFTNGCDSTYGSNDRCRGQKRERAQRSNARAQQAVASEGIVYTPPKFLQNTAGKRAQQQAVSKAPGAATEIGLAAARGNAAQLQRIRPSFLEGLRAFSDKIEEQPVLPGAGGVKTAGKAVGPAGSRGLERFKGLFRSSGGSATKGAESALPAVQNQITGHAAKQMAERGITQKMVDVAVKRGTQYYDRRNEGISHVLDQGFASGKSLIVGRDPLTGNIKTAIRQGRPFNPNAMYGGQPRYIPIRPGG